MYLCAGIYGGIFYGSVKRNVKFYNPYFLYLFLLKPIIQNVPCTCNQSNSLYGCHGCRRANKNKVTWEMLCAFVTMSMCFLSLFESTAVQFSPYNLFEIISVIISHCSSRWTPEMLKGGRFQFTSAPSPPQACNWEMPLFSDAWPFVLFTVFYYFSQRLPVSQSHKINISTGITATLCKGLPTWSTQETITEHWSQTSWFCIARQI